MMYPRTTAALATTPTTNDIGMGWAALYYDSLDPTKIYQLNHAQTAYIQISASNPYQNFAVPSRVAMLGDELFMNCNATFQPNGGSRTSNVTSLNFAAAHKISSGSDIRVFNLVNVSGANVNAAVATRISSNVISYPNSGVDGSVPGPFSNARVMLKNAATNVSLFMFANSALGGGLSLVDNLGEQGETTVSLLNSAARIAEVTSTAASCVWVLLGTNDAINGTSVATITANLLTIWQTITATGRTCVAFTLPPLMTTNPQFSTAMPIIIRVNAWIRQYARTLNNVILVDLYDVLVNKTATDGSALTNMLQQGDGYTFQTHGARVAGREIARVLGQLVPPRQYLISSAADYRANNSAYPNVWLGVPWTNSGGTLHTGFTGTVAQGLDVSRAGGTGTGTCSVLADPDGYGYMQQVVYSANTIGEGVVITNQDQSATAYVTPGEKYRLKFRLRMQGAQLANVSGVAVVIQANVDGTGTVNLGTPMYPWVSASGNVIDDWNETIISPDINIPPGTTLTSLSIQFQIGFANPSTAPVTIQLSRTSFDRLG